MVSNNLILLWPKLFKGRVLTDGYYNHGGGPKGSIKVGSGYGGGPDGADDAGRGWGVGVYNFVAGGWRREEEGGGGPKPS